MSPHARFSLEIGYEFGQKTHLLLPGGVLVDEEPWRHAEAVARIAALMADPSVPVIFEAASEHVGVRVRVDMLKCLADGNRSCARSRGAPASRVITTTIPLPRPTSSNELGFRWRRSN